MARFVDLVAVEGPDKGMRYSIEEGTYRVLARAQEDSQSTLQMTPEGDRALDREAQQRVDELFSGRTSADGGRSAGRARTGFRKRGPDIVLKDGSVSRTHALVFVDKDSISLADLMSTNGTKVNGGLVSDVDLREGDVVHVGKTRLRIEEG